jgi:hypothetical protein
LNASTNLLVHLKGEIMHEVLLKRDNKTTKRAAGALGATALACAACCAGAPFVVPLLAWLGLSGLTALSTGWYVGAAAVFAAGLAALLLAQRRRAPTCAADLTKKTCNCETACTR